MPGSRTLLALSAVLLLVSAASLLLLSSYALALLFLLAFIAAFLAALRPGRNVCANCGEPLDPAKAYKWYSKLFCSRKCKREYRRKHHEKRRKSVLPASGTLEKVYWRRY